MLGNGELVAKDLALLSAFPSTDVEEYNSMWACGNHFLCLPDDETVSFETFDSGVFVMSLQGCRASMSDKNVV